MNNVSADGVRLYLVTVRLGLKSSSPRSIFTGSFTLANNYACKSNIPCVSIYLIFHWLRYEFCRQDLNAIEFKPKDEFLHPPIELYGKLREMLLYTSP